jgi:hypothetical protein
LLASVLQEHPKSGGFCWYTQLGNYYANYPYLLEDSSRIFLGRVSIPNTPFLITEIRFLWQGEYADKDAISEESVREKCDIYLFIFSLFNDTFSVT